MSSTAADDAAFVGKFFLVAAAIFIALATIAPFVIHFALAKAAEPTTDPERVAAIEKTLPTFEVPRGYRVVAANSTIWHRWVELAPSEESPMRLRVESDASPDSAAVDRDIRDRFVADLHREDCASLRLLDVTSASLARVTTNVWRWACVYTDDTISHERIETESIVRFGRTFTIDARGDEGTWDGTAVDTSRARFHVILRPARASENPKSHE